MLGIRVVRGPKWHHGDQDGGEDHLGTVIDVIDDDKVQVQWDMGEVTLCDGTSGVYELRVFDSAPTGICMLQKHADRAALPLRHRPVCLSVRHSIRPSVSPSVRPTLKHRSA